MKFSLHCSGPCLVIYCEGLVSAEDFFELLYFKQRTLVVLVTGGLHLHTLLSLVDLQLLGNTISQSAAPCIRGFSNIGTLLECFSPSQCSSDGRPAGETVSKALEVGSSASNSLHPGHCESAGSSS